MRGIFSAGSLVLAAALAIAAIAAACDPDNPPYHGTAPDADADSDTDSTTETDPDSYIDSDGDHLSDAFEEEHGTDPNDDDSDDDGYSDYIEEVAGTDPNDPNSNPGAMGWFYFLMPYLGNPDPDSGTFAFATDVEIADVFLLMDTTGSMGGEIATLKSTLTGTIVPALQEQIDDVRFGVGFHDDYPDPGYVYGSPGTDSAFGLLQPMTASADEAQIGVDLLATHSGNDAPESQIPALWAIATGGGLGEFLDPQTACAAGEYGYPCFRPNAMPIVIMMTDAPFHNGPGNYSSYDESVIPDAPTYIDVVAEYDSIHAKVLPVFSSEGDGAIGLTHCEDLALDTGAAIDGEPLVFEIDGSGYGLDTSIVDAVDTLVTAVPLDISAVARDDLGDDVDAAALIDHVAPNPAGGVADPADPDLVCVGGLETADIDDDPEQDVFIQVQPGVPVCFDITPIQQNDVVPATDETQVFRAYVDVFGDVAALLDTREVYFVVPPEDPLP